MTFDFCCPTTKIEPKLSVEYSMYNFCSQRTKWKPILWSITTVTILVWMMITFKIQISGPTSNPKFSYGHWSKMTQVIFIKPNKSWIKCIKFVCHRFFLRDCCVNSISRASLNSSSAIWRWLLRAKLCYRFAQAPRGAHRLSKTGGFWHKLKKNQTF